jgi:UDP-N-acetylmuramoyl-tripeptide--D-alanyl-D-alanine ligase
MVEGVGTDSRTIQPGNLFIALQGPHFDGHDFLPQVWERGAAGAVVSRRDQGQIPPADRIIIQVEDTLQALGDLAHRWRTLFHIPLIGLSGSNGKTTTKEMIASILETRGPVLKNPGNLNNRIGLPLTLLTLGPVHRSAVLEMGMNQPGEIRRLAEIAVPAIGLLTSIGPAHLEGLGSLENIARAKGELFAALTDRDTAVVNRDDPWIMAAARECPAQKIFFGLDPQAEVCGEALRMTAEGMRFRLRCRGWEQEVRLPLWGEHNVRNALGAAATGVALGLDGETIRGGLERFTPPPQRFRVLAGPQGSRLIDDSYNANPASVQAALDTFQALRGENPGGMVLGDMLELGDFAEAAHREIGRRLGEMGLAYLLTLGPLSVTLLAEARRGPHPPKTALSQESHAEVVENLRRLIRPGDWVLFKGSHGMALEKVVRALERETV